MKAKQLGVGGTNCCSGLHQLGPVVLAFLLALATGCEPNPRTWNAQDAGPTDTGPSSIGFDDQLSWAGSNDAGGGFNADGSGTDGDLLRPGAIAKGTCSSGEPCIDAPEPACQTGAKVLRTYTPQGQCIQGKCVYEVERDETCPYGCAQGTCVADLCAGFSCVSPPSPSCSGNTRQTYAQSGTCRVVDGEPACQYEIDRTEQCSNGCSAGSCVSASDPCAKVTCNTPPSPICVGTSRRVYQGSCLNGSCAYDGYHDEPCAHGCAEGSCLASDPCANVTCNTPPSPICVGTSRRVYEGSCQNGSCRYDSTRDEACDAGCEDGACIDYRVINRFVSAELGDHFDTWLQLENVPKSYRYEHSSAVLAKAGAGRIELYVCKNPQSNDYMMSLNCAGEGYANMGLAGYIWDSPGSNRLPYYRCRIVSGTFDGDHFMTTDTSECSVEDVLFDNGGAPVGYVPQIAH